MPFARLKELTTTLRFRLILWVTLVVAVLVILSMVAIGQAVRRSLVFEFDALLSQNLADFRLHLKNAVPHPRLFGRIEEIIHENENIGFIQIYHPDHGLLWSSSEAPSLPAVGEIVGRQQFFQNASFRFVEGKEASTGWLLRLGLSRAGLDEDIALLNRIMILSSACILTLTPLAGFFLAARATRPLQWIIATTSRLQPERLSERLPVRATGDELDQLSVTINGMLDRIASYIQRNRDFIGSAAHELRSPLAAIRSSVEVALNRPRSNEEYAELLESVTEECARMGNLVDRLLLLAEGDAGKLSFSQQTGRLDKVVRESVDMFQGVAEVQEVPLTMGPLPALHVRGEETHLRQVVRNLIDNALKFTCPPGKVHVTLENSADQKALLSVVDEGAGIAPEDLTHIFERFYRGDKSRQRQAGRAGTGLGLSICETIVHALGGKISVASQLGKGTRFTVEFPIVEAVGSAKKP